MVIIVSYVQAHFRHLTAAAYAGELANQMMMNARVKTRRAKLTRSFHDDYVIFPGCSILSMLCAR